MECFLFSLIRAIKTVSFHVFAGARPRSRARRSDLDRLCDSPPRAPSALPDRLVKSPTFISEKTYKPYSSKRPSTSRTYLSSLSNNHVDIDVRDPGVKVKQEKSSLMDQEPAFVDVTKDVPGLTVWRLEVIIPLFFRYFDPISGYNSKFLNEFLTYYSICINMLWQGLNTSLFIKKSSIMQILMLLWSKSCIIYNLNIQFDRNELYKLPFGIHLKNELHV